MSSKKRKRETSLFFSSKTFSQFIEKNYLCALKMTITLFLTKIVIEYNN